MVLVSDLRHIMQRYEKAATQDDDGKYVTNFTKLNSTRTQNKVHNRLQQIARVENEVSFRKVQPGASPSGSRRRLVGQKLRVSERHKSEVLRQSKPQQCCQTTQPAKDEDLDSRTSQQNLDEYHAR